MSLSRRRTLPDCLRCHNFAPASSYAALSLCHLQHALPGIHPQHWGYQRAASLYGVRPGCCLPEPVPPGRGTGDVSVCLPVCIHRCPLPDREVLHRSHSVLHNRRGGGESLPSLITCPYPPGSCLLLLLSLSVPPSSPPALLFDASLPPLCPHPIGCLQPSDQLARPHCRHWVALPLQLHLQCSVHCPQALDPVLCPAASQPDWAWAVQDDNHRAVNHTGH
jgi:hypothetical protein